MIALFNIAKPAIQSKTELPFTLDEERTVDGDNTHESMSARLPSTFYFSQDIEHKIPQEFSPFLVPHSPRASAIDLDAMRRYEQTRLAPSLAADSPLSMAVQHFLAALTMDDEHLPARTWLGRCYWQQGRYELARVELERAAKGGRIRGRKVWAAW